MYKFLDKWIKIVNVKLGNEMWKVNWSTWHDCGTKKKKNESLTGIELMTSLTGRLSHMNSVEMALLSMSSRSWVRFLLGTRIFSLSHAHVMLICLLFAYKFLVDFLGSHLPTGQTVSDRITESSVIPPRENSLDLLPVRHYTV